MCTNINFLKFVKQTPTSTFPIENKTSIGILFESNDIEIEKEVFAFPSASLVADVGGILGLFIGFNFLMIWDFMADILSKMKNKFCNQHPILNIT